LDYNIPNSFPERSSVSKAKAKAKPRPTNPLDELLPLLQGTRAEIHRNIAVLEVTDAARMIEFAADPKVRRYLLGRLSDTVALVDPGQEDALTKTLLTLGHTPKVTNGDAT